MVTLRRRAATDATPSRASAPTNGASASQAGDEGCVAAQGFAVARGSVDNEVEAATVVGVNLRRCCALQPLLRHDPSVRTDRFASDLNPRPFNDETTPGQQARAWAGEVMVPVCIDLKPTSVSAFSATVQGREGQGQPKAAPHCDVCVRTGARVVAASARIAGSHIPACGPD